MRTISVLYEEGLQLIQTGTDQSASQSTSNVSSRDDDLDGWDSPDEYLSPRTIRYNERQNAKIS